MSSSVFKDSYIPDIVKWGRGTVLVGIFMSFAPLLVLSVYFGIMPPLSAIIAGVVMQLSVNAVYYFVEPIAFFPILGIPGTYMAFLSGNISNLRIPCAAIAQQAAGVKAGTEQGAIMSTLGIAVSIIVNIIFLTFAVFAGTSLLAALPQGVTDALYLILPALFGAVFGQFAIEYPRTGVAATAISGVMSFIIMQGVFDFLPTGMPWSIMIIVSVFGTIQVAKKIEKPADEELEGATQSA